MEFKKGASVFTVEGDKVGTIERVVIDPATQEVSHVVVQRGFLFTEDKVLPIDLIAEATNERVTLKDDVGDLDAMPKFEETYYVPATLTRKPPAPHRPEPLYHVPPVGSRWWNYPGQIYGGEGKPRYVRHTERNIPEGAVALREGVQVISADGERVGDVKEVFVDKEDDSITHLLISRGFLFEKERFVPVSWIDGIWEDAVHLLVESSVLDKLQSYLSLDQVEDETSYETSSES